MAIDRKKLEAAIQRGGRARGVSVPASVDLAVEKAITAHVVGLWDKASRAALARVPATSRDLISDISQRDITRIINQIYRRYSGLTALDKRLKAAYERGNAQHKARYLREMERALGVDVGTLLNDPVAGAEVRKRVDESVGLITSLDDEMKARLARDIWNGIALGEDRGSLRKLIYESRSVPMSRARLIARDQTAKMYSNLSRIRQEDVGITEYIWRTVGDGAVRPEHEALDGTTQRWDAPPSVGHPGEDIQCRCIADPVIGSARLL